MLDICQSSYLLDPVSTLIGPDFYLWDSRFYRLTEFEPEDAWLNESKYAPIEPMAGVTVHIPINASVLELEVLSGSQNETPLSEKPTIRIESLSIDLGYFVCHDINLPYRYTNAYTGSYQGEYIIQYASGNAHFVRDQASAIQQSLADRLPLINFGQAPIWLVRGVDHRKNDYATGFAPAVAQWKNAKW